MLYLYDKQLELGGKHSFKCVHVHVHHNMQSYNLSCVIICVEILPYRCSNIFASVVPYLV